MPDRLAFEDWRRQRQAKVREHNKRIIAMSDDEVDRAIVRVHGQFHALYDDPEQLLWLAVLLSHRANRLELGQ